MALTPGTRLGPYEVVAPLGAGGMGEVYKAKDTRLDRTVAIKVLPPHVAQSPEARQRFEREARAVSSLNHPHICTLYDVGHQDGVDFLVMEHLEGQTLADRLDKGTLPVDQVLRLAVEVAGALDKAHRQGVVHRDLKPGNVMLTKTGTKLLDFGLAKLRGPESGAGSAHLSALATGNRPLTEKGTVLGTFQYMAPEQLEGKEADARTDVFSLGTVIYEMATGRKAFEGKSQASLIAAILERDPPPISSLQPMTPPALDHLVRKCLEKDPEARWQSALDVATEIQWITESASQTRVAGPTTARRKPRESLAWSVAVVMLVAAAGLGFLWRQAAGVRRPTARLSIIPPENVRLDPGSGIALSPDGRRLVFVGVEQPIGQRLWIRSLEDPVARPLAGTEGASYPFWSPDSRYVAFFANQALKRIDVKGGTPETVCKSSPEARGGSWGSDGRIVFAGGFRDGLNLVPASGGAPSPLTRLDERKGEISHRWPTFLPDGRHVIFLAQTAEWGTENDASVLAWLDLDTGERRDLTRANSSMAFTPGGQMIYWKEGILWARGLDAKSGRMAEEATRIADGVAFTDVEMAVFTVSEDGTLAYAEGKTVDIESDLVWMDRQGHRQGSAGPPADYQMPALSHDGRHVSYASSHDIWVRDLERGTASRLSFSEGDDSTPIWSSDDRWILWSGNAGLEFQVRRRASDGTGEVEELFSSNRQTFATSWSPDQKTILLDVINPGTVLDIMKLSLETRELTPFVQTPFRDMAAAYSPDGRWIAYATNDSGRFEVYAKPAVGEGGRLQISTAGGDLPRWSRDGRELYFISPGNDLMAVAVQGGDRLRVGIPKALYSVSVHRGISGLPYDVASDGRFLLAWSGEVKTEQIMVVQNWAALLRRE